MYELTCIHCNKISKNSNSHKNHVRMCRNNPARADQSKRIESIKTRSARGTFRNQWSDPNYTIKEETRQLLSDSSKRQEWTAEKRQQHSISMKRAVASNPDSYTKSNRGRTRAVEIDGLVLHGRWELEFYQWAKAAGLEPKRPKEGFPYEWEGSRTYFPDFYIESKDLYVEVKGYETERDRAKWLQFPEKLCIIKEQQIKQIRKDTFKGL